MDDLDRENAEQTAPLLAELKKAHRQLDERITALELQGETEFEIMSLKRQKLKLKDEIARLIAISHPDIIA